MDTSTLYNDDIVTWAEQQASALRQLAAKPELSNAVDWENLLCVSCGTWTTLRRRTDGKPRTSVKVIPAGRGYPGPRPGW